MNQFIRIIDYENDQVHEREIPNDFEEYLLQLVAYINTNKVTRDYKTRSTNTEILSCILDIIKDQLNEEIFSEKSNKIANRLLLHEIKVQRSIAHLGTSVQKGSLIQVLLYNEEAEEYSYLLAKVEHSEFVDVADYSFKMGFSKATQKIWKSCIFEIKDMTSNEFYAKVYSDTEAKYWTDGFLELDPVETDEKNTQRALAAIGGVLKRNLNESPRDLEMLQNAVFAYFKNNGHIDYDEMIKRTFERFSFELGENKKEELVNALYELPEKKNFDRQFSSVPQVVNKKAKRIYDVYNGIQIVIKDAIDDYENVINAYRAPDGTKYLRIKTDMDIVFNVFATNREE